MENGKLNTQSNDDTDTGGAHETLMTAGRKNKAIT